MKKLAYLEKNSFTLIETLFSLIILSVIIGGYTGFITNHKSVNIYNELQNTHNNFIQTGNIVESENFTFNK